MARRSPDDGYRTQLTIASKMIVSCCCHVVVPQNFTIQSLPALARIAPSTEKSNDRTAVDWWAVMIRKAKDSSGWAVVSPIWAANWVSVNPTSESIRLMRRTPVSPSQGMIRIQWHHSWAINLPSRDTAKPNTSLGCPTRRFNTFFVVNSHRQTVLSLELVTIRRVSGRTATAEMDS
ncbi:hypothetical protein CY34DRAFT_616584 [Suillus luteus UH-Slu-Lm8-n1]|uniref:Uncharacterized protein n=1 Tax=Suillus luteus UH-Slu-Lm8-n1 TaxID=930992 RepID=A0A0D0ASB6_9AGAM|nr:hypothetical protein CY34DRAFT_616584 [Suillus luteus UH-Slu-Lm8-n1]